LVLAAGLAVVILPVALISYPFLMLFLIFCDALLKNVLSVAGVLLSSTYFCHQLQDLLEKLIVP
jgi:hypothetical protein